MSINDFFNKIKGQISIDNDTFLCLCIIILVAFSSFGLGRLSVSKINKEESMIIENKDYSITRVEEDTNSIPLKERVYVASKNGKLYYTKNCSGAKRIKVENQVWFATSLEAEKAGYKFSLSCNN